MTSDEPPDPRFEVPELRLPDEPVGAPSPEGEDRRALALLEANGIAADPVSLAAALEGGVEALQAAAARTLGARGVRAAIEPLRALARRPDDTARVEAALALARLGEEEGAAILRRCLDLPLEGRMAPVLSAGALAALGEPAGLAVLERALDSGNPLIRGVASRQLVHLVPLEGADAGAGRTVDAFALIDRALADEDADVAEEARSALRHVDSPRARERLERLDRGS